MIPGTSTAGIPVLRAFAASPSFAGTQQHGVALTDRDAGVPLGRLEVGRVHGLACLQPGPAEGGGYVEEHAGVTIPSATQVTSPTVAPCQSFTLDAGCPLYIWSR